MHFCGVQVFPSCAFHLRLGCSRGRSSPPLHPLQFRRVQADNVGVRSSILSSWRLIFVKHVSEYELGQPSSSSSTQLILAQKTQVLASGPSGNMSSSHLSSPSLPQKSVFLEGSIHLPHPFLPLLSGFSGLFSWYPNVGTQRHVSSSTMPLSQAEERGVS